MAALCLLACSACDGFTAAPDSPAAGAAPPRAASARPSSNNGAVLPVFPDEKLVYLVPAGWHSAHVVRSTLVDSIEYVPPDQDRRQWTDMVTAVYMDRAMYHHLADASATMRAMLKKRCASPPDFDSLRYIDDNGFDATIETISCGKTPEGFGHVAVIKTIKSDDGYYQVQRAWRFPATTDSHSLMLSDARMHVALATLAAFHLTETNMPPSQGAHAAPNAAGAQ